MKKTIILIVFLLLSNVIQANIRSIRLDVDVPHFDANQRQMYQSYLYVLSPIILGQKAVIFDKLDSSADEYNGTDDALNTLSTSIDIFMEVVDKLDYSNVMQSSENELEVKTATHVAFENDYLDIADYSVNAGLTLYECWKTLGNISNDCIKGVVETSSGAIINVAKLFNALFYVFDYDDFMDELNSYRIAEAYIILSIKAGYSIGINEATVKNIASYLSEEELWKHTGYKLDVALNAMTQYWNIIEATKSHYPTDFLINLPPQQPNSKPYVPYLEVLDGTYDVSLTPMLRASGWRDPDSGDYHAETWWGILSVEDGRYVYDSGWHSYDKYEKQVPSGILTHGKKYKAVVAFKDNHGNYSNGRFVEFRTAESHNISNASSDFLYMPLSGYQHATAPISSFFDHDSISDSIELFTGEIASTGCTAGTKSSCHFSDYHDFGYHGYGLETSRIDKSLIHYDGHKGIDYVVSEGTGVTAAADGIVVHSGWENDSNHNQGFGKYVKIYHYNGYATYYGHLSSTSVSVGSIVSRGQSIGSTGQTGNTDAPHLHFEVRKNCDVSSPYNCSQSNKVDPFGTITTNDLWADWNYNSSVITRPSLTTGSATNIGNTSVTLNATIDDDGGASILERHFDWGQSSDGSDFVDATSNVSVSGNTFSYNLSGLEVNTTYYFRAWARNSQGWSVGSINSFTTGAPLADPDLIVISPTVDITNLSPGQSFSASATVKNQGSSSASSTTLRYYRSSNSTILTSDTQISTDPVSSLSAGGTSFESDSVTAPNSPGTYWIGACVDSVSGESDTSNNCSAGVQINVSSVSSEDYSISNAGIDGGQTSALRGSNIYVSSDVCYSGSDPDNASSHIGYYYSTDQTFDASDVLLREDNLGYWSTNILCRYDDAIRLTLDETLISAGQGYILFAIDDLHQITEVNESNNVVAVPLTIVEPSHDVYPTDQAVTNGSSFTVGDTMDLSYTERYSGNSPYRIFTDSGYYLSSDNAFDSGDVLLTTDSSSLGRGDFDDVETASVTVPSVSTYGQYYVLFVSDRLNKISETDENNNVASVQINILDPNSVKLYVNSTGGGTVTSSPAGINCNPDCEAPFPVNSTISLNAHINPIWDEGEWTWSGGCSGGSSCVVTMDSSQLVNVKFDCLQLTMPAPFFPINIVQPTAYCNNVVIEQNYEIAGTGAVTIEADNSVTIGNGFSVQTGGVFSIKQPEGGPVDPWTPDPGGTGGND